MAPVIIRKFHNKIEMKGKKRRLSSDETDNPISDEVEEIFIGTKDDELATTDKSRTAKRWRMR